jgi:diguanylate cyclase (GGDEF)-like protein
LKARYTSGSNSQALASLEIPVGQGLSGWVVENGKAIINGNPAVEPGCQLGTLNSALSIPLGDGVDQFSGVLTLYRAEKDAYSADHLRVLLAIKGDIARAVDGALRFQKARQGAGSDELTGLASKAALLAYLQDGFVAQRKPATVLLCDIDEFRRVNELFGRPTANELLKLAANILRTNSRSVDYVARVGGDEFVLLLAAARPEELAGKIESLDRLVANACRGLCGEESSGLAVGVACFPENGADADSLVAFAEQALASAKEARRARRNVVLQLEHSLRRPA